MWKQVRRQGILLVACTLACSGTDTRRAEFKDTPEGSTIVLEIVSIHPVYAEYNRFVKVSKQGKELAAQKLFPDSGGYASTNLYLCSESVYCLVGYFDSWVVNLNQGTITEGHCEGGSPAYIGIFEGGGSRPWKFYGAAERKETKLVAKGG